MRVGFATATMIAVWVILGSADIADAEDAAPATQTPPVSGAPATPPAAATPPPAAVPAPPRTPPANPGTQAVVLDLHAMEAVIGKSIRGAVTNEDLGRLIDVLVGPDGKVRAAVIDFGGVLGVGGRKVAVDWTLLDFGESGKTDIVKLALSRNEIRVAPEFRSGEPIVVIEHSKPEEPEPSAAPKGPTPVPATPTPSTK